MKKTRYIFSIAALVGASLLIAACQKEKDESDTVDLTAYADDAPDGGKAYVSSNYICWNDKDAMNINNSTYQLSVSGASEAAASATIPNVTAIYEGYYTAAYPDDKVTDLSTGSVTINVPAIQTYTTQSSPGRTKQVVEMPMVGQCAHDAGSIHFHNAAALIKVTVTGAQKVYKIEVSADASAKLCGSATVNPSTGTLTSSITGGNIVTLDCSSYPDAGDFYLVVTPFTNENITVTVWATGENNKKYIATKTSSGPKTLGRNKLGTVTVTVNDDGSGPYFWGGDGLSDENPWLITSEEDLTTLSSLVKTDAGTFKSAHYQQANDITISGTWSEPIGTTNNFSGTYDGDGKTVTFATFSAGSNTYGFFKKIDGGTVKNMTLAADAVTSTLQDYVGAFCGAALGTTTFNNCVNQIALNNSGNYTAGICGAVTGGNVTFTGCRNEAVLTVGGYSGGIAGRISGTGSTTLTGCENSGAVSAAGKSSVGGILGDATGTPRVTINGTTTNSGSVNVGTAGSRGGGIVGSNTVSGGMLTIAGTVANSGAIYGSHNIGGIIGYVERGQLLTIGANSSDRICNEGNITTPESYLSKNESVGTGGIIGCSAMNSALTVRNCKNSGAVNGRRNYYTSSDYGYVGGIVGFSFVAVDIDYCSNEGSLAIWNHSTVKWETSYPSMNAIVGGSTKIEKCTNPYPASK